MPIPAYMSIKGQEGQIKGGSNVAGREGTVEVLEFHHQVRTPTDSDTGALTSTRKHEALTIVKEFDSASPSLYKAVCEGETLPEVVLDWYKINEQGQEVLYFKQTLTNAKVCSVEPVMHNVKDKALEGYVHMEKVSFRYEEIKWVYLDGNLEYSNSWSKGR